jgi:hypothetical protein
MANPNQPHNQQNRPQQNQQHQNRPPQHNQQPQQRTEPTPDPEPNNSTDNLRSNQYEQGREEKLAEHIAQDEEVQFRSATERWSHTLLLEVGKILKKESTVPEAKMRLMVLFQNLEKHERELIRADLTLTKIKNIVESLTMDMSSILAEKW